MVPKARLAALILAASGLRAQAPAGPWEALEAQGARIAAIRIVVEPVFDLSDANEDTWIGRLGNALHADTREGVIRRELTIQAGDAVDARRIHELERQLRALRFIKDADITPDIASDGSLTAVVRVRDAWTLKLSAGYSQEGGHHAWSFGLQDQNLLGTGKALSFSRQVNPDRTSNGFTYKDPQVFGSRWTLVANYQSLSDGFSRAFSVARPFYEMDTPWSFDASASTIQSRLLIFDHDTQIFEAPSKLDSATMGFAWRLGGDEAEVWRAGIRVEGSDARYGAISLDADPGPLSVPALPPRRLRGPSLTVEWVQDGFRTFRDLQGMDTPEDYNLGWSGEAAFGTYTRAWGGTETAPFFRANLAKGWSPSDRSLLLATGYASARRGPTGVEDGLAGGTLTAYAWGFPHQVLAGYVAVDAAHRPDPESILYLGGFEGLRGYTDHIHPGDRRWLASVEHRTITDWRWLGILRVGFVAFADAGAIHLLDGQGWSRTYADIGGGLRFGDLKSSLGRVVYLTMAYPLVKEPGEDKWQLVVGNTVRF